MYIGVTYSYSEGDLMNKRLKKIIRHGQPGILDEAPHGTACFVPQGREHDVYVQVSHTQQPRWELLGTYPEGYNKKELKEEIDKFKNLRFGT